MNKFIVFLRGINVGGHHKILMADLRNLLNKNGYLNSKTYIQSGNIILDSHKNAKQISKHVKELIAKEYQFNIPVITISGEELLNCFSQNPFLNLENDIKKLHVTFLSDIPNKANVKNLDIPIYNNDQYNVKGKIIYLHTPDGFAKTKFNIVTFEKKLLVQATTRNWNTITKLVNLLNEK
ncbi:DUF1697 domain-containing protein [Pseudofulvibacter geojedonensis]|uniref:DUF1697 domain-containing protein n=1 Tax=Pseudofulvibacter geojedonensis TaxID=1123758 RepID=A0ABW3I1G4_9FLAO